MVGSSPHGAVPHQLEQTRSQQQDNFPNPEHGRNEENGRFREGSVDTTQTSRSHTRVGSHMSQKRDDERAMQQEINDLKRRLRFAQRRQSPPPDTDTPLDDYRRRSKTPPSETFSYEEERHQKRKRRSPSPRGIGHDTISRALNQLSRSPFTHRIEEAVLPRQFQQLAFSIYNGNTDHSKDEVLMCKVFPSSLGPAAMRWFNGLKANFINSYRQLTQAFGSPFITNNRAPQPLSALLSLPMRDGETLKAYSGRYWKMYNEMDGNFDDVAINTFKSSLPVEHGLRKSLIGKPTTSVR